MFKNNFPGRDWANLFLKRHQLVKRYADKVKPARGNISLEEVDTFFANLKESLSGVPPSKIFNYDETNFSNDPGKEKVSLQTTNVLLLLIFLL